jgi:4-amino-4-deoxy-L-arabinose transferase-like glycosyltransferase
MDVIVAENRKKALFYLPRIMRDERLYLALILLWAAALRLGWPGINSFSFDEARVSDMALHMVRAGDFAELGMQSSTGVPNFPGFIWLLGIPYLISTNPLVATLLIGLINVAAVGGIYWLARQAWGTAAALLSALLFATSPFLIFYSRNIWGQNLLAPLAILWAVAAVKGIRDENGRSLALHVFLSGFTAQVHTAGAALAPVTLYLFFRFRLWRQWRAVLAGGLTALAAGLPTIWIIWRYGEGAQAELRALLAQPSATYWQTFGSLVDLALNRGWEWFWLNDQWSWPLLLELIFRGGILFTAVLALLGAAGQLRVRRNGLDEPKQTTALVILRAFLFLWLLAAPLFFLRGKTPAQIHYQLVSLPAALLLMGAAVTFLRARWWPWLLGGVVLLLAVAQTVAVTQTLQTVSVRLVPGGIGTPLAYPQAAVRQLQATERPIIVSSYGDAPEYDGDAAVFTVLLWGDDARVADGRSALLLPDGPVNLLFTYDNLAAWEIVQQVKLPGIRVELPRRAGELPYVGYQVAAPAFSGFQPPPAGEVQLANGATLVGWQVRELADGRLRLLTHWRLAGDVDGATLQQFNHLYVAGANAPQQVQDRYTASRVWRRGDHLISWAEFNPPPGPLTHFHVGMYSWPDLQRVPLRGAADAQQPIQLDFNR